MSVKNFEFITSRKPCYELEGFKTIDCNREFLYSQGIQYEISDRVADELKDGYKSFNNLFENKALMPPANYSEEVCDVNEELEIHNYTGMCPKNVLEVTPSKGSCSYACQYCLVTDGNHIVNISVFSNYIEKLKNSLVRNKDKNTFYYFSPKTDCFSEPHLFNGLAHEIILAFVDHFDKYPDSKVRIFIASKAGMQHLNIKHKGLSLYDCIAKIGSKIQYNGSIGIMPSYLRDILEPNVASIEERLEVLERCREVGVHASSVLAQPLILPYLTEKNTIEYMDALQKAGVDNIKPEFLTTEVKNLVLIAQFINHYDSHLLGEFFEPYLMDSNQEHLKQRSRLAPRKELCVEKLSMIRDIATERGISISICNWVKQELSKEADWVGKIDKLSSSNGYKCLGYQQNIFK